jgi:hypothetical protein
MSKSVLSFIFLLNFCIISGLSATFPHHFESSGYMAIQPDTLDENQILYNGREWKNHYYRVEGDQFLFSSLFLPGSLTIQGKTFSNIRLKVDVYHDEILTPFSGGIILQLNKEMTDSFSVYFQNRTYRFTKIPDNGFEGLEGYVQVIYKGMTALYVKYIKKIDRSAVENKNDKFYQVSRIYFVKDNLAHLIASKKDLYRILEDDKVLIRDFIKKNQSRVYRKEPESFVPVIRFYDSINQ